MPNFGDCTRGTRVNVHACDAHPYMCISASAMCPAKEYSALEASNNRENPGNFALQVRPNSYQRIVTSMLIEK